MDAPDGQAFFEYPHIGLLGHEMSQNFTATANINQRIGTKFEVKGILDE